MVSNIRVVVNTNTGCVELENIPKCFGCFVCEHTPVAMDIDTARFLARDLRYAADPWNVDHCLEWLRAHGAEIMIQWECDRIVNFRIMNRAWCLHPLSYCTTDFVGEGLDPDGTKVDAIDAKALRRIVHVWAAHVHAKCPMGYLCHICGGQVSGKSACEEAVDFLQSLPEDRELTASEVIRAVAHIVNMYSHPK